jgi:hypothetical protein
MEQLLGAASGLLLGVCSVHARARKARHGPDAAFDAVSMSVMRTNRKSEPSGALRNSVSCHDVDAVRKSVCGVASRMPRHPMGYASTSISICSGTLSHNRETTRKG